MGEINRSGLPRLAYVGDVPVESSYHGSALLFRLLRDYPVERLLLVQPFAASHDSHRRLPNVKYVDVKMWSHRLLYSRFTRLYRSWLMRKAKGQGNSIGRAIGEFEPTAVLTVAHGVIWIAAAAYARQQNLPLYLIVHDHWPRIFNCLLSDREFSKSLFRDVTRQAAKVFCVSPAMLEHYDQSYGVRGCLLYPSQSVNPVGTEVQTRSGSAESTLTLAFAGTINSDGYAALLRLVAVALHNRNGKLLLFGPHTEASLKIWGLNLPGVENRGLIDSDNIASHLITEADVLLVAMSFGDDEKDNMTFGFPSKIAEYSATGRPMLIFGPEYCSAVQWARQHPGVAEVVTSETGDELGAALTRLASAEFRISLGQRALELGRQLFSPAQVEHVFLSVLTGTVG